MRLRTGLRAKVLRFLDWIRFRLQTTRFIIDSPRLDYQPAPWLGIHEAEIRGDGTIERWYQIHKTVMSKDNLRSALDIGCCYGYLSVSLAKAGFAVMGVDMNPRSVEIANRSAVGAGIDSYAFVNMEVTPRTVYLLPATDVVLCLAVWHHWVKHFGIESATEILRETWARTESVLFFESGEDEDAEEFDLPFDDIPARKWLAEYLSNTCSNSKVTESGAFPAGMYAKYGDTVATRALFVVERQTQD